MKHCPVCKPSYASYGNGTFCVSCGSKLIKLQEGGIMKERFKKAGHFILWFNTAVALSIVSVCVIEFIRVNVSEGWCGYAGELIIAIVTLYWMCQCFCESRSLFGIIENKKGGKL